MPATICQRCGTCCRKGGPALHIDDLDLLAHIPMSDLVCLRKGEPVFDPRADSLLPLKSELLKIRGKGSGWECVYFAPGDKSCTVYGHRPLECRSLSCSDTCGIFEVMGRAPLTREDVIPKESALWACIVEHEHGFPVDRAFQLARQHDAAHPISEDLDDMIRRELAFRQVLAERVQTADEALWAYFGRPLWMVLVPLSRAFGRYEHS